MRRLLHAFWEFISEGWFQWLYVTLIRKLLAEAVQTGITYAEFIVADDKVIFICDGGSRKSTHNHKQSKADIKEDEKVLKTIS